MTLNAVFHRKEPKFDPEPCAAEKIIELSEADYWAFRQSMLQDQPFIAEFNNTLRARGDGMTRCLLVLGEGCDDGVLIDPSGSNYARYAAFIPGARQLLEAEQMHQEQAFTDQIKKIEGADIQFAPAWMEHARSIAESDTGTYGPEVQYDYLLCLREFGDAFRRIDRIYTETPAEIFNHKPGFLPEELLPAANWISNGGFVDEAYDFAASGIFQPSRYAADAVMEVWSILGEGEECCNSFADMRNTYGLEAGQIPRFLEELRGHEGLESLHVNEESGEFTVYFKPYDQAQATPTQEPEPLTQDDLEAMEARHTLWRLDQPDGVQADFSGRVLSGLDFNGMDFCNANFAGAAIHGCCMGKACFDDSDFTGAKLRGVTAYQADFDGAKFIGATLEYSIFPEARFIGADFSQAEILECDGLDDITQGPVMAMGG